MTTLDAFEKLRAAMRAFFMAFAESIHIPAILDIMENKMSKKMSGKGIKIAVFTGERWDTLSDTRSIWEKIKCWFWKLIKKSREPIGDDSGLYTDGRTIAMDKTTVNHIAKWAGTFHGEFRHYRPMNKKRNRNI